MAGKPVNFPQLTQLRLFLHMQSERGHGHLGPSHALRPTHLRISYLTDVSEELEIIASKFLILAHGEPEPCFSRGRTVHDTKRFKPRTTEPACPRWLSLKSLHQVWQVHGRLRQLRSCGGTIYQSLATSRLRHLSLSGCTSRVAIDWIDGGGRCWGSTDSRPAGWTPAMREKMSYWELSGRLASN